MTATALPLVTAEPSAAATPTAAAGVRAPKDVVTQATVRGVIWLGFEGCVGLTPDGASPYLPPPGQDDFVLFFPRGWRVEPEHPKNPRFGDHFQLLAPSGQVVAHDGDVLEVAGEIRALEATYCGFGWPIDVGAATHVAD